MSREPLDSEKIQAPSLPEIKDAFVQVQRRLSRKIEFRSRKMGVGPLLNAIVLDFLTKSADEQEKVAAVGVARYVELLDQDESGEAKILEPSPPTPKPSPKGRKAKD